MRTSHWLVIALQEDCQEWCGWVASGMVAKCVRYVSQIDQR